MKAQRKIREQSLSRKKKAEWDKSELKRCKALQNQFLKPLQETLEAKEIELLQKLDELDEIDNHNHNTVNNFNTPSLPTKFSFGVPSSSTTNHNNNSSNNQNIFGNGGFNFDGNGGFKFDGNEGSNFDGPIKFGVDDHDNDGKHNVDNDQEDDDDAENGIDEISDKLEEVSRLQSEITEWLNKVEYNILLFSINSPKKTSKLMVNRDGIYVLVIRGCGNFKIMNVKNVNQTFGMKQLCELFDVGLGKAIEDKIKSKFSLEMFNLNHLEQRLLNEWNARIHQIDN